MEISLGMNGLMDPAFTDSHLRVGIAATIGAQP